MINKIMCIHGADRNCDGRTMFLFCCLKVFLPALLTGVSLFSITHRGYFFCIAD